MVFKTCLCFGVPVNSLNLPFKLDLMSNVIMKQKSSKQLLSDHTRPPPLSPLPFTCIILALRSLLIAQTYQRISDQYPTPHPHKDHPSHPPIFLTEEATSALNFLASVLQTCTTMIKCAFGKAEKLTNTDKNSCQYQHKHTPFDGTPKERRTRCRCDHWLWWIRLITCSWNA